jgi:hypothetical protein
MPATLLVTGRFCDSSTKGLNGGRYLALLFVGNVAAMEKCFIVCADEVGDSLLFDCWQRVDLTTAAQDGLFLGVTNWSFRKDLGNHSAERFSDGLEDVRSKCTSVAVSLPSICPHSVVGHLRPTTVKSVCRLPR